MKKISPVVISLFLAGVLATPALALNLDDYDSFDWLKEDITIELPESLLDQQQPCLVNCTPKPTKTPTQVASPAPTPTAKPTPTPTPVQIDVRTRERHSTREWFNRETSYEYNEDVEGEGENGTTLPIPTPAESQSESSNSSSDSLFNELMNKIGNLGSLLSGWL
jgi:hypothetical protein